MQIIKKSFSVLLALITVCVLLYVSPITAVSGQRVCIEEDVNVRTGPGTEYASTGRTPLGRDTYGELLGTDKDSGGTDWYRVLTDYGTEGYVSSLFAYIVSDSPATERFDFSKRVMITDTVNVRKEPSSDYGVEIIAVHWPCSVECRGKTVNAKGELWYNIITAGGLSGYIRSDYIVEYSGYYDAEFEKTLLDFPYNYREGLRYLHSLHPNWSFYADKLPITLEYAVNHETGRKLLHNDYTSLPESWRTSSGVTTQEPGYRFASATAIKYFMKPENFIAPNSVFMFLQQSYDALRQNADGVRNIVSGTFLETEEYVSYIMEAAVASNVSPYVLAGTILQEQSIYGSYLCYGNYPGFEGYYNFFNVGASGSTQAQIIESGLSYARTNGWNSVRTAIVEGAKYYGSGYVNDNQDTYYYKNFNVINQTWGFQYATNIHDSLNNARYISGSYQSASSSAVFRIPVYAGSDYGEDVQHTHIFDGGTVTKAATATETGIITYTCEICGHKQNEIIPVLSPLTLKKGDINGDGYINTVDGALLRMHFLNVRTLDASESQRADINGDTNVDTIDGALMRMHFLGIKLLE